MSKNKPVVLMILDGWGINDKEEGNAVKAADTPFLDNLYNTYPSTKLDASGESVGLPKAQMGNSEVGHLTIGSGRILYQDLTRINKALSDKSFYTHEKILKEISRVKAENKALHLMGLVSPGGVHSHSEHLKAFIDIAKKEGVKDVFIHAFLDGRDTAPQSAKSYIEDLQSYLDEQSIGKIASISGRYYAMDRDNRWERVERAFNAIANRDAKEFTQPLECIEYFYDKKVTDEFLEPSVIMGGKAIEKDDGIIFFNFRSDRAREITRAFAEPGFNEFKAKDVGTFKNFLTMTDYSLNFDVNILFPSKKLDNILSQVLEDNNVKQFRTSETEKYAHVTFFFNGGREEPFINEDRLLIDSVKDVATYDLKPEMRALEIARAVSEKIEENTHQFILLNIANGDMVGHTGVFDAAVKSCETVDKAVGLVVNKAKEKGYTVLITADHGNAEEMIDYETHNPMTAHTTNPVPFIVVDEDLKHIKLKPNGGLHDIAPTVLNLLKIEKPLEIEGQCLIIE